MILINIGDELLIGQVVNTNAAFIGQQMALAGFSITDVLTIGDNEEDIRQAVNTALAKTDIVLMTGGLGPTKDDITKKVICNIFQRSLIMDKPTLEHVTQLFAARGMELTETNRQQALVPDGCTVLSNPLGTAPGLWVENDGKVLIALPGVPFEMERLLKDEVLPRLKSRDERHHAIEYRVLQCTGITESGLSDMLVDYERELPAELKLAYLPKPGIIRLRLTGQSDNREELLQVLDEQFQKLKTLTKEYAFTDEDIDLEEVVGRLLVRANKTLAASWAISPTAR